MTTEHPVTSARDIRVGIVGTGYIAEFHAKAIRAARGADLVGVADRNAGAARAFGAAWGVPAFDSLEQMTAELQLDAIHLLVPPDLHYPLADAALTAGLHVFVEKPMCVTVEQAEALKRRGEDVGRLVRVNHSMLFGESYARLRDHVRTGALGPLDHLAFNHFAELGFIRFGPFGNWMLREPGNALLEIGSHPISGMVDLVGEPDALDVVADREVRLPGGAYAYRRWRIRATAGRTAVDINLDLGPGFGQRTVSARGALGSALADLDADICTLDRRTRSGIDVDRYRRSIGQAKNTSSQARHALSDYMLSKIKLRSRGNPYEKSILDSVAAFYAELRAPGTQDSRIAATTGASVVASCSAIIGSAHLKAAEVSPPLPMTSVAPKVLVLGGTGFIGRCLIEHLLQKGYAVRAAGRSVSQVLLDLGSDRLEVVRADMRSATDLERALDGIEVVFHLATSDAKNWPQFLEREVEPSRLLAEACLAHGVSRLIYTGTIDSYYAGARAGVISEDTPLDGSIARRNYYARAKAEVERMLTQLHQTRGLPLVTARPGIVIGRGGNPFHWGIGSWRSDGVCEVWGEGKNKLPLVLVDDVAAGLVRCMEAPGLEGRSFNFIDAPMLSARDYLNELQEMAGMRIDVHHRPIASFYTEDLAKWLVKVAVGHHDAARRPSYRDWESRTQKAHFDCTRTRAELGWTPASEPGRIVSEGIAGSLASWLAARG